MKRTTTETLQTLNVIGTCKTKKMVAALQDREYDMAHVFGSGGHADDHGGAMLPQMLRWIWKDHPSVQPTTTDLVAEAAAIEPQTSDPFPAFDPQATVDPSGTYAWSDSGRHGNSTSVLTVNLANGKLAGTYSVQRDDAEPATSDLINPVMQGNKLAFDVKASFQGREFLIGYQGIVTEQGIDGWRLTDSGGRSVDSRWIATHSGKRE